MSGTHYPLEVQPIIPEPLSRLHDLATNLLYSWDRAVRGLFRQIDPVLWDACKHDPEVFLRRVAQERLNALAEDRNFLQDYREVVAQFDAYLEETQPRFTQIEGFDAARDLVAYFCMEYGLHESLRLYSGGLGVLAGDHCKAASDLGLPFVAVGLMYRQGYFDQTIGADGSQQIHYNPSDLQDLPIHPVLDGAGKKLHIELGFPGRQIVVRAWRVDIGHVKLYLLDTDLPDNVAADRTITYQLYGGDRVERIEQELVLGVGGVRLLRAVGLTPSAWHINEGHPAFMILERCRELVHGGLDFDSAFERVAADTVFTTHTPVPAGHDLFSRELMSRYFQKFVQDLGIPLGKMLALGDSPQSGDFNMTALAMRGSRFQNGVSRIHGRTASEMEAYVWPQVESCDNPVGYVTNGVHVPTFLAREWANLFDARYAGWRNRLLDADFWRESIEAIPNHRFWSLRQSLKSEMLEAVVEVIDRHCHRNQLGRARIGAMHAALAPDNTYTLVIGFARRFATYKRALLLFDDPPRLARLLNQPGRPVVILFAGKAHPKDGPGQALIKRINEFAAQPEFMGKVFFLEGYDLALARKLVTGTDVWLNTPEFPLEASGTSGQKAAINGSLNLSILDGWWAEGFDGHNGWAIQPHDTVLDPVLRDHLEAQELLHILETEVLPRYFDRDASGYPEHWVEMSKASMMSVLPRFSARRMVMDYVRQSYVPAIRAGRALGASDNENARVLASWKAHIRDRWGGVALRWISPPPASLTTGEMLHLQVAAKLNELSADDLRIECLLHNGDPRNGATVDSAYRFLASEKIGGETRFELQFTPPSNGLLHFRVHAFPWHSLLGHPYELGLRIWL